MIGFVVIGRNEGERLQRCLVAARRESPRIVYVDSNSTDNSVEFARSLDVHVVVLDSTLPFSAARGRNAGFAELLRLFPDTQFAQFIDGDCEIRNGWIDSALAALTSNDQLAIVCGRRRERYPDRNVFHRLINLEWDTPCGLVDACGGDALVRVNAFAEVKGFNPAVVAGEEPELCFRLRAAGYQIMRIDHEMTFHDINMSYFKQWWKRSWRSGFGAADVAQRVGATDSLFRKQNRSAVIWGAIIPGLALTLTLILLVLDWRWALAWMLVTIAFYTLQLTRIARRLTQRGIPFPQSLEAAGLLIAAKPAEFFGRLQYMLKRRSQSLSAFEYK